MDRKEFIKQTANVVRRAHDFSIKNRKHGIAGLEDELDTDALKRGDVFEYGIRFAIEGADLECVERILSGMISRENDEYTRRLKTIQKVAVTCIQGSANSFILLNILFSYIDDDEKKEVRSFLADGAFKEYFDLFYGV